MELNYVIHYEIAAFVLIVMIALHFFLKKTINTRLTHIFTVIILCSITANIFDMITIVTISNPGSLPRILDMLLNQIYLISFNCVPAIYFLYIVCATIQEEHFSKKLLLVMFVPVEIVVIAIMLTPINHWVIYFNEAGEYQHGSGMILLYACAFFYMLASLAVSIVNRKKLTKGQRITVWFYTISCILAILLQYLNDGLMIIQFAISVCILMIYLSLENPQDYMDKQLGTLNHLAFMQIFQANVRRGRQFHVLAIQIEGLKYINDVLGVTVGNGLMKEIAEYLLSISGKQKVYHMSGAQFVVMGVSPIAEWEGLLEKVHERFRQPFWAGGMEISLSAPMCMMTYPDTVERLEDAIDMIEYSLNQAKASGKEIVIHADKEILEKGKREALLLQLIRNAIREKTFEVYYQPIFSVVEHRYTTAEALIRLRTEELGFISPEEFIPIAEKNGLILEIGSLVFNKVCSFYTRNKLRDKGIENIHVNLSVVECMQEKLSENLLHTMDKYGLDYQCMKFEITETAAVASKDVLRANMDKLISQGIEFALDDYGTGFSNMATIINYPFSTIKLDKSMIWSAMDDEKAMIALKHIILMSKDLKLHIVAEGVETLAQANHLASLGCDYFQGYYFTRPIDEEDFLRVISKKVDCF